MSNPATAYGFVDAKQIVDELESANEPTTQGHDGPHVPFENEGNNKPYLGGYRGATTGREFHHATCQTDNTAPPQKDYSTRRTRDTQTYDMVTRSQQTYREAGTQMARTDLHMDNEGDRDKIAGPYFTAAGLLAHKRNKAIVIQRCWRGYLARSLVWYLRNEMHEREVKAGTERQDAQESKELRHQREMLRRMHPRTRKDFAVLYNELEVWCNNERQRARANSALTEGDRAGVHREILDKESKVLQAIDRLKIRAAQQWKLDREYRKLQLMALPKQWQMGDGELADVHTAYTIRAQELLDLYKALNTLDLSVDDRLTTLLHIKWTITEFDTPLVREMVYLIDREADLHNRGRSESSLEGLRLRLSNLFLDFCQHPMVNREAERFRRVRPQEIRPVLRIRIGGGGSASELRPGADE